MIKAKHFFDDTISITYLNKRIVMKSDLIFLCFTLILTPILAYGNLLPGEIPQTPQMPIAPVTDYNGPIINGEIMFPNAYPKPRTVQLYVDGVEVILNSQCMYVK